MPAEVAAKRYAQAAFGLAGRDAAAWTAALDRIAVFLTEGDSARVLTNRRVAAETKQEIVEAGLGDLPRLPLNLARLLVQKGRSALARQVADYFGELLAESEGRARASAVTAVELSDQDRENLTQRLRERTGRRILLETSVDPAILGGIVVQIGDRLIDGSTRARLNALRRQLVGDGR